jgi:hypothetical protein
VPIIWDKVPIVGTIIGTTFPVVWYKVPVIGTIIGTTFPVLEQHFPLLEQNFERLGQFLYFELLGQLRIGPVEGILGFVKRN